MLTNRPVLVPETSVIRIVSPGEDESVYPHHRRPGWRAAQQDECVLCRSSDYALHLIRPPRMLFFDVLRAEAEVGGAMKRSRSPPGSSSAWWPASRWALLAPDVARQLAPISNIFLRLIKSIIAPLLFGTLVYGIAGGGDLKRMGRIGAEGHHLFRGRHHRRAVPRPGGGEPGPARRRHEARADRG